MTEQLLPTTRPRRIPNLTRWGIGRWLFTGAALACFAVPSVPLMCALLAAVTFVAALIVYRLNFNSAWVAFALPWAIVLLFGSLEVSEFSRDVSVKTIFVIASGLIVGMIFLPPAKTLQLAFDGRRMIQGRFIVLIAVFVAFTMLNVTLAGYIPLVSAVTTGESGYMEFGVKGLYGLYNAYTNAFGLTAFYFWLRDRDPLYLYALIATAVVFVLFVTRQNLVSLGVECFIVYSLCKKPVAPAKLVAMAAIALILFGFIGDLRVDSDIAELANIQQSYRWLPNAVVWLYSYSYFNLLNLDNVVTGFPAPAFDGSSLVGLIPSFLRPGDSALDDSLLEVSNFNVTSYASPIFRDFGLGGVALVVLVFALITRACLAKTTHRDSFAVVASYAVLYFCFAFSFFVNFWFYLPIIFQPVFLWLFGRWLLASPSLRRASRPGGAGRSLTQRR